MINLKISSLSPVGLLWVLQLLAFWQEIVWDSLSVELPVSNMWYLLDCRFPCYSGERGLGDNEFKLVKQNWDLADHQDIDQHKGKS